MTVNLYLLDIIDGKLDISVLELDLERVNARYVLPLCTDNVGFMLETEEEIKIWNKFWEQAFCELDDDDYYHYEYPVIPLANRWYCYDVNGCWYEFPDFLKIIKEHIGYYKRLETALEGI